MSDSGSDPAMQAAARLDAAVERLAMVLHARLSRRDPAEAPIEADPADMVPRAEVAALAERLEGTIARLRAALPDEIRLEPREHRPAAGPRPEGGSGFGEA